MLVVAHSHVEFLQTPRGSYDYAGASRQLPRQLLSLLGNLAAAVAAVAAMGARGACRHINGCCPLWGLLLNCHRL